MILSQKENSGIKNQDEIGLLGEIEICPISVAKQSNDGELIELICSRMIMAIGLVIQNKLKDMLWIFLQDFIRKRRAVIIIIPVRRTSQYLRILKWRSSTRFYLMMRFGRPFSACILSKRLPRGFDGLHAVFYQSQWDVVRDSVCTLVKRDFTSSTLPKEINKALIVQIP